MFPRWLIDGVVAVQASTGFPTYVNEHGWVWPIAEILHFMGLCLLFGTVGAYDLRLLGVARGVPIRSLERLIPWGVAGFVLCAATGVLFVFGNAWSATEYLANAVFAGKVALIALGGLNVLLFHWTGTAVVTRELAADADAPACAKAMAALSLTLWIAVIFLGRFLPILGDAF